VPTADSGTLQPYVYILASGGDSGGGPNSSIMLTAGLGDCTAAQTATVQINEMTTIATAYAMAQFLAVDPSPSNADDFGVPGDASGFEYVRR